MSARFSTEESDEGYIRIHADVLVTREDVLEFHAAFLQAIGDLAKHRDLDLGLGLVLTETEDVNESS